MASSFNPDDIYLIESMLGVEEKLVMDSTREYAQNLLEPRALEGNQDAGIPARP